MAEEQSSLRTAIDAIMGWPAGQSGKAQGGAPGGAVQMPAPSLGIGNDINATGAAIANTVPVAAPDPLAAQLAEIKAQTAELQRLTAPAAASTPAVAPLLSYDQYLGRESERNQGRATPKETTAIGYNQYQLAQPRSSPLTRDQYAKTVAEQYERAGWNRQGIVQPDQRLIDTGYQSYLQGVGKK